MYVTTQRNHVVYAWLFRYCGRIGGLIILLNWLLAVIADAPKHEPVGANYLQLIPLAVIFAGYAIGWRKELLGGAIAILGAMAFVAQYIAMFGAAPLSGALSFALPGVFYLVAHYLDERPVIQKGWRP